jgi:hypothetical protein
LKHYSYWVDVDSGKRIFFFVCSKIFLEARVRHDLCNLPLSQIGGALARKCGRAAE